MARSLLRGCPAASTDRGGQLACGRVGCLWFGWDAATTKEGEGARWGRADNPLLERFLEVSESSDPVDTATGVPSAEVFSAGVAGDVLQTWVDLVQKDASDPVDEATPGAESEAIGGYFTVGQ